MPAARWWEVEDGEVNFGNLDLDVTETGMMLLGQYLMMFGNDWLVAPLTIPAGQLCRVEKALITDVFGQQVYLQHYRRTPLGKAETDWGLFEPKYGPQNLSKKAFFTFHFYIFMR